MKFAEQEEVGEMNKRSRKNVGDILYIKATVVVSVYLCGQCLEDSSSHYPFPVELPQM
jgi:hypothetical protein